jgi:hypothetical protein
VNASSFNKVATRLAYLKAFPPSTLLIGWRKLGAHAETFVGSCAGSWQAKRKHHQHNEETA